MMLKQVRFLEGIICLMRLWLRLASSKLTRSRTLCSINATVKGKSEFSFLNKVPNVQVSDTTDDENESIVDKQNISF